MKVHGVLWGLILFLIFISVQWAGAMDYRSCLQCHQGIEKMDEKHDFPCQSCHLLPGDRERVLHDHRKILRYPGAEAHMGILCGDCHQKEISILQNSLWTLLKQ